MRKRLRTRTLVFVVATAIAGLAARMAMADSVVPAAASMHPNLAGQLSAPLRYTPEGPDFVIRNGREFFNRPLYGGNTAFRVDGGDKPEFSLYLPGRGGNLRLGIRTAAGLKWLQDADALATRYRPGELRYEIADALLGPRGHIEVVALAYAATEGVSLQVRGQGLPQGTELLFAFGPGNGQRGRRDGDIGTERVPIAEYFQFQPAFAQGSRIEIDANGQGVLVRGKRGQIAVTLSAPAKLQRADAAAWSDPAALLASTGADGASVAFGRIVWSGAPVYLSAQVVAKQRASELATYREVGADSAGGAHQALLPAFRPAELASRFDEARRHFDALRNRVRIDTPDPFLNAAMGALNVAADAVWDEDQGAIMHGAIAWRTKLLGWRGPYALDALGWHDRARRNFEQWTQRQDTSPIPDRLPPADEKANLSRNEAGLHSNGDMSHSHYDMNKVFVDALLRHLLWTGDVAYAKAVWPVLERHLAWQRRLFRREFGLDKQPLYEAYADIWASDDIQYSGGGVTYASAYNAWHNHMAARIARLIGKDPLPYEQEAARIEAAMRSQLWMPERGAFAEYRDLLGRQLLHPSYGLWTFYHTIDSRVPDAFEAALMASDLDRHLRALPVTGPGVPADAPYRVLPTTNWMPYTWSANNVVMGETVHTALAYWQAGRSQTAFELTKGALLASLFMGVTPGNIGTMNYLDVYRRESQRDFADGSGVLSRALVEGLFGVEPDALAGTLTVRPGFPSRWNHARLEHPDLSVDFRREGQSDHWTIGQQGERFRRLVLILPATHARIAAVRVSGRAVAWQAVESAVGRPRVRIELAFGRRIGVDIVWSGSPIDPAAATSIGSGGPGGRFAHLREGDFSWWRLVQPAKAPARPCTLTAPGWIGGAPIHSRPVALGQWFNDRVSDIFKPDKYRSPRSPFVSLALPAQGIGAWAGHMNELPVIDDAGLRGLGGELKLANGLRFLMPSDAKASNVIFASQWDNYPRQVTLPLDGHARRAFLLMTGSTNHMQSRIDNGEVVVTYTDGSLSRLALRNPENWWPIEQDYFVDDYQFPLCGTVPVRVDLKTALVHVPDAARFKGAGRSRIDGGAATVLELPLDARRSLRSVTMRALANDVVIGLMGLTLDQ
jgi:hypothetical protein